MSKLREFSAEIIDKLQYYVYIYSDPDTGIPFYIGKGKGNRCFDHLNLGGGDSEKNAILRRLKESGKDPVIEILVHGVDEETALKVEAAAIDLIGIHNLSNVQKGHHASVYGRIDVDDLNARYSRTALDVEDITDKVIMIRINQRYHYGISDFELYEVTRFCWRVNKKRADNAEYVFSLYDGMIVEVYKVTAWLPACSTMKNLAEFEAMSEDDTTRFEFVGKRADDEIRKKYVGKIVSGIFSKGSQNPIRYINV